MANIYVRSTDGSNSDNGSTWALAKADLTGAAAIDSAGDTIFVSQAHAESTASSVTIALAGTVAAPTRIICGNDGAEPPTAVAVTGQATTTVGSSITITGNCYVYGMKFSMGSAGNNASFIGSNIGNTFQTFERCQFLIPNTGSGSRVHAGGTAAVNITPPVIRWINCDVRFGAAGQGILGCTAFFHWRGGSLLSGGTSPTTLFVTVNGARPMVALIEGVDLVNLGAASNIFAAAGTTSHRRYVIRNCKLPASWSGALALGTMESGDRYEMYNCDAGDTNYRLWIETYLGSTKSETTIVKTAGASDGTTPLAWKMVSGADTELAYPFVSPEIVSWNDTTGSAITVTVDIVHDSVTNLTDAEVWLEVQYLGTSGFPLSTFVTDAIADPLATPADQTSSSATWTTTGLTDPNKQKLEVTFTPQEKGYLHAKVHVAKASATLYVDPLLIVT